MQHAFSLIELMVVIAVVAILAAVAIPSYKIYTNKGKAAYVMSIVGSQVTAAANAISQGTAATLTYPAQTKYTLFGNNFNSSCDPAAGSCPVFTVNIPSALNNPSTASSCTINCVFDEALFTGGVYLAYYYSIPTGSNTINWICYVFGSGSEAGNRAIIAAYFNNCITTVGST